MTLREERSGVSRSTGVLSVIVVILAATVAVLSSQQLEARTVTSTVTSTDVQTVTRNATLTYEANFTTIVTKSLSASGSTTCVIMAESGPLILRVLNDSTDGPVAGVSITAVVTPLNCNGQPAEDDETVVFTTTPSMWYSIHGDYEDGSFAITAGYAGHTYNFNVTAGIEMARCATLYLPSGRTNVTNAGGFENTCS